MTNKNRSQRRQIWSASSVVLSVVAAGIYLYTRNMGNTFVVDEWMFIGTRHDFSWQALLAPHNGHLSIVPVFIYVTCFKIFGLGHYEIFRVLAILVHLATCLAIGEVIRRKHRISTAFCVAALLALSGIGAQNSLWGFQIGFMGGVLYFVISVLLYDRIQSHDDLPYHFLVMLFLCLALGSSATGLPALGAFWLLVVFDKKIRRMWWVASVPSLLYLLWSLKYGGSETSFTPTPAQFVDFVIDGMSGSLSGLFGVDIVWGRMALGALLVGTILDFHRHGFSVRRNIWLVFALGFWCLTALKRAAFLSPLSSRYVWVGSILLVTQVFEYLPRYRLKSRNRHFVFVAGLIAVFAATLGSYPLLVEYRNYHRGWTSQSMVRNTLLFANRERVEPASLAHSGVGIPLDTTAGFFTAVDLFGEPESYSAAEILADGGLRVEAEKSMVELGLMNFVAESNVCERTVMVRGLAIEEGMTTKFKVFTPTVARLSRFLSIDQSLAENTRTLEPGVYSIGLGRDGLGPEVLARFDSEVGLCG